MLITINCVYLYKCITITLCLFHYAQQDETQSQSLIEEQVKNKKDKEQSKGNGNNSSARAVTSKPLKRILIQSEPNQKHNVVRRGLRHDLSKWRYAELRDTLNTSCGKCHCLVHMLVVFTFYLFLRC